MLAWVAKVIDKNTILNNLSEIVIVIPYAATIAEEEVILKVPEAQTLQQMPFFTVMGTTRAVTIQISVKTVTPPLDSQVLKLNCEVCEYDIIVRAKEKRALI